MLAFDYWKRRNRHQHLKIVINTFRLQHPSPTSMLPIFQIKDMFTWKNMNSFYRFQWHSDDWPWELEIYFIIRLTKFWFELGQDQWALRISVEILFLEMFRDRISVEHHYWYTIIPKSGNIGRFVESRLFLMKGYLKMGIILSSKN